MNKDSYWYFRINVKQTKQKFERIGKKITIIATTCCLRRELNLKGLESSLEYVAEITIPVGDKVRLLKPFPPPPPHHLAPPSIYYGVIFLKKSTPFFSFRYLVENGNEIRFRFRVFPPFPPLSLLSFPAPFFPPPFLWCKI